MSLKKKIFQKEQKKLDKLHAATTIETLEQLILEGKMTAASAAKTLGTKNKNVIKRLFMLERRLYGDFGEAADMFDLLGIKESKPSFWERLFGKKLTPDTVR